MAADLAIRPVSDAPHAQAPELAARAPHVRKTADAAQKFEAFVLQTFIQEMMPETQESVFGSGISGDFWKSMMAEKVAEQVAARGSLGIADMIRAGHLEPAQPRGFNPLDLMRSEVMSGGAQAQLDVKSVPGE